MNTMLLVIAGALAVSLVVFFICEKFSLIDNKLSEMKCIMSDEVHFFDCFAKYQTFKYVGLFFMGVLILGMSIAYLVYIPNAYGFSQIALYTFTTALLGSTLITLIKWSYHPVIKLIASFIFGSVFMGASATAFGAVYLLSA